MKRDPGVCQKFPGDLNASVHVSSTMLSLVTEVQFQRVKPNIERPCGVASH